MGLIRVRGLNETVRRVWVEGRAGLVEEKKGSRSGEGVASSAYGESRGGVVRGGRG
jgi:hypothetical protein